MWAYHKLLGRAIPIKNHKITRQAREKKEHKLERKQAIAVCWKN